MNYRLELESLQNQREGLEIEAEQIKNELNAPGENGEPCAGLQGPLIDSEGFPRHDVDIPHVLSLRKRLREINFDYTNVMKKIENLLPLIYQENMIVFDQTPPVEEGNKTSMVPFARIDEVLPKSPAAIGGIQYNDLIIKFGAIDLHSKNPFGEISDLVRNSLNKRISLVVQRGQTFLTLSISPSIWEGRGVLGCHLSPL